ncbi:hypothetical protein HMPREF3192_01151 [Atopobium deltae]|uniref:Uncharacterized protein n=1 Tax=Atopobium deltae TaxID=1393034 RepID=A0A133XSK7_9ACTN|nr:hypothetical protein HMPREF3192_01151 [Atopobium deltae]
MLQADGLLDRRKNSSFTCYFVPLPTAVKLFEKSILLNLNLKPKRVLFYTMYPSFAYRPSR